MIECSMLNALSGGIEYADVAELADALASGASECKFMWVRLPSSAPNLRNPNQILQIGDGFGFLLFFSYDFFPNGAPVLQRIKTRGSRKKKKYNDSS